MTFVKLKFRTTKVIHHIHFSGAKIKNRRSLVTIIEVIYIKVLQATDGLIIIYILARKWSLMKRASRVPMYIFVDSRAACMCYQHICVNIVPHFRWPPSRVSYVGLHTMARTIVRSRW